MRAMPGSPNKERRLMYWLIALALLAAVLVWLLGKLGFPFTPFFAATCFTITP